MWNPFKKAAGPARSVEAPKEPVAQAVSDDVARAERLMAMISVADSGLQLATFLKDHGIQIRFLDALPQGDTVGTCVLNTRRIDGLSPYRFTLEKPVINLLNTATDAKAAMALLHEGRHAMQAESGLHPVTRYLSRDDTKSYIRMVEADAGSFTIITALKIFMSTGDDSILKASVRTLADDDCLAKIVKLAKEYGPHVASEPAAQRALFDAWFADKAQVARYDRYSDACWQSISAAVHESLGVSPVPPPLTKADFIGLGTLTHKDNYLTVDGAPDVSIACALGAESKPSRPAAAPAVKAPAPPRP